jgi:ATP-dependent DNA ligase
MTKIGRKSDPLAAFNESMECLLVAKLREGPEWTYEINLDSLRLEAVKAAGTITL